MPPASAVQKIAGELQDGCAGSSPRCQDRYTRAIAPIAAVTVRSSIASVLASRASAPSSTQLAIIRAARCSTSPGHERKRGPVGQKHRADGADQRGNAIEPDPQLRPRHAELGSGFDDGSLQPIDADRLFVADVVLEADIDEIAAFDHLLGRLRKPRLVAIDRGNRDETGHEKHDAAQQQEHDRAKMVRGSEFERSEQPAAGIRWFYRLLACSKSPGL